MNLRLGHSLAAIHPTLHNGPGWRIGLWVQGCVHRCTEQCLSPHLLDPNAGRTYSVVDVGAAVSRAVFDASTPVEGLTILGGEPFEQAAALAELLVPLRDRGLSTMVYSGHTIEYLRRQADAEINALLLKTDILVDGPFLPQFVSECIAWRGSSNQRLLCLSDRYTSASLEDAFARQGKGFSIQVEEGRITVSGLQSLEATGAVVEALGLGRLAMGWKENQE